MRNTSFLAFSGLLAVVLISCGGGVPTPASGAFTNDRSVLESALPSTQLHYRAVPLPKGFVPLDIMKDGQVPGSISTHAAIYKDGHLSILPDFTGCVARGPNPSENVTATSVNSSGEAVGFCNLSNGNTLMNGFPLFYKDGHVRRLVSPEQGNSSIVCMSINDLGVIVGAVNVRGNSGSVLYQFYSDGRRATFFGEGGSVNCWIDHNGLVASGTTSPAIIAEFVKLNGFTKRIFPDTIDSQNSWMNDNGVVVGGEAPITGGVGEDFVDAINAKPTLILPGSNGLTGINDKNVIIGQGTSGIFIYSNGEKTNISPDITPTRDYAVSGVGSNDGFGYLGGLSDRGEFVAQTKSTGKYYFISPDR